jgi:hypothetical protein
LTIEFIERLLLLMMGINFATSLLNIACPHWLATDCGPGSTGFSYFGCSTAYWTNVRSMIAEQQGEFSAEPIQAVGETWSEIHKFINFFVMRKNFVINGKIPLLYQCKEWY